MSLPASPAPLPHPSDAARPLPGLAEHASRGGQEGLAERLRGLQAWLAGDLQRVEEALAATDGPQLAQRAGQTLLAAGGKRLRPLATLLAARLGPDGRDPTARAAARELAVAVELVHNATLLHDDVVDLADRRRGQATVRALHGNEVSIFAGDWLLVEALRRIRLSGHDALVALALDTIEQMIFAEVEQLERARRLAADREGYLRVIDGKTAALFRWALRAGARAGGCDPASEAALVRFGSELGVAFQLTDDVLDLDGEPGRTGKALLADLAEGKITLPLALLLDRRPELREDLIALRARRDETADPTSAADPAVARILQALRSSSALSEARAAAEVHAQAAVAALDALSADRVEVHALRVIARELAGRGK